MVSIESEARPWQDLDRDKALASVKRETYNHHKVPVLGGMPLWAKLADGNFGAVYFAIHLRLHKPVAVKVLTYHLADQPELKSRFYKEARAAAKVQSPYLIKVLDVDEDQGFHFIVVDYVHGKSAAEYLGELKQNGRRGLEEREALSLCGAAGAALAAEHARGILHRDVQPDSILVPKGEKPGEMLFSEAKLLDLGIARVQEDLRALTGAGRPCGTPGYMAPEQWAAAHSAAAPADVFGLGATLYALLTGSAPFLGRTLSETVANTLARPHTPVRQLRPEVTLATAAVIDRCLAKKPEDRYPDGVALLQALEPCLEQLPPQAAPVAAPPPAPPPEPAVLPEDAPTAFTREVAKELALDLGNNVKLELVLIPAGRFMMGSPESEEGRGGDETQHEVHIRQPFYMGRHEVTVAQFRRFVESTNYRTQAEQAGNTGDGWEKAWKELTGVNWAKPNFPQADNHPVCLVSWQDALAFCQWAGEAARLAGPGLDLGDRVMVRLPTEAEWEYACQAGTATRFNTGDKDNDLEQAAWLDWNANERTHPVGQKRPNAWGLYDMHGNVSELVQNCFSATPAGPEGLGAHGESGRRGGGWLSSQGACRAARRQSCVPGCRAADLGFRVVLDFRGNGAGAAIRTCGKCGGMLESGIVTARGPGGTRSGGRPPRLVFVVPGTPAPNNLVKTSQGLAAEHNNRVYNILGYRCPRCGTIELYAND